MWDGKDSGILLASAEEGVVRYRVCSVDYVVYIVLLGNMTVGLIQKFNQLNYLRRQWLPVLTCHGTVP